VKKSKSQTNN